MENQDHQKDFSEEDFEELQDTFDEEEFDKIVDEKSMTQQSDMDTMNEESYNQVPLFIVEAFSYHKDAIQSVKVNPMNNKEILTGGMDNIFNVINSEIGQTVFQQEYEETIAQVEITKDGSRLIANCLDNKIFVFSNENGQIQQCGILEGPDDEITYIETHPQGNVLVASSLDGTIWMWNLNNGKVMTTFYGHEEGINKVKFTPNKKIASISDDCTLKVWKFGSNQPEIDIKSTKEKAFHSEPIIDFSFHLEKQLVSTISLDKTFCLANYVSGDIYYKSSLMGDLQTIQVSSIYDNIQVGNLEGDLSMIDMNKQIVQSYHKSDSGIVKIKFWDQRKLYVSSTVNGDLIFNGSGAEKDHRTQQILNNDYIHDFDFIDENLICIGAEDSYLYIYDIRKGTFKENNQLIFQQQWIRLNNTKNTISKMICNSKNFWNNFTFLDTVLCWRKLRESIINKTQTHPLKLTMMDYWRILRNI